MVKPTGPENPALRELINELRRTKDKNYLAIAKYLSRPKRTKKEVNLDKINKDAQTNEKIVVPSKVLGDGTVSKPLVIYAWQFSKQAREKIIKAGGKSLSLNDFLKEKTVARMIV